MAKKITVTLEGDLFSWCSDLVGKRGATVEDVINSLLVTARGRHDALATYRATKKVDKPKKAKKAKPPKAKKPLKVAGRVKKATPAAVAQAPAQ